jgi:hypothetical protein
MAGRRKKDPLPLYEGTRADGSPCNSYRELGSTLCRWHRELGAVPLTDEPDESDESEQAPAPEPTEEHRPVNPLEFRGELAKDLADDYAAVKAALQAARNAKKEVAAKCPVCNRKVQVEVTDHRVSLDAIRLWNELGYGRPAQVTAAAGSLTTDLEKLKKAKIEDFRAMSTDELLTLVTLYDLEAETAAVTPDLEGQEM